jgi:hypothetical protein
MSPQIKDHNGNDVTHRRETVNEVRLHYVTAGSGEPLVILHGVLKSSWYWSGIIPLRGPGPRSAQLLRRVARGGSRDAAGARARLEVPAVTINGGDGSNFATPELGLGPENEA